jgi:DNA-binding CsgD family transcriptional regulator
VSSDPLTCSGFDTHVARLRLAHGAERQPSPLAAHPGRPPVEVAVGTVDPSWIITSMSAAVEALVGLPSEEITGRRLLGWVDQRDVRTMLDAGRLAHRERSTIVHVHVRNGSDGWTPVCCVVTPLVGSMDLCVILLADPAASAEADLRPADRARVARLEEHLWRIAAEVEASGIPQRLVPLPDPARFPQMGGLSTRQSEVLLHLVRGERVPTIAEQLFLSQSTVRNHLAAIFRRFGVHSQAELLALFVAERPDRPPA